MSKSELITKIMRATGENRLTCDKVVDAFIEELKDAICDCETISLQNFVKIEVNNRPPREGRNPSTGEVVTFPEVKTIKFKVSKSLKDRLNGKE